VKHGILKNSSKAGSVTENPAIYHAHQIWRRIIPLFYLLSYIFLGLQRLVILSYYPLLDPYRISILKPLHLNGTDRHLVIVSDAVPKLVYMTNSSVVISEKKVIKKKKIANYFL